VKRRAALVSCAAALLAGCAGVIPPRAPLPADAAVNKPAAQGTFIGANSAYVASGSVPNDWWRLYESPTLDGLVQQALAANTDLRAAAANLQKAQAALDLASAAKEPSTTISASPSFSRRSAQEELHPGKPFPSKFVYGAGSASPISSTCSARSSAASTRRRRMSDPPRPPGTRCA
jgi:outer membrane protein TolC